MAPGAESRWRRFAESGGIGSTFLAVAFLAAAVLMDTLPADPLGYRLGQYLPQDIHARVDFAVLSGDLKDEVLQKAAETIAPVFRPNTALIDETSAALKLLSERIKTATRPAAADKFLEEQFALTPEALLAVQAVLSEPAGQAKYQQDIDRLARALPQVDIVRGQDLGRNVTQAVFLHDGRRMTKGIQELIRVTEESKVRREVEKLVTAFDKPLQGPVSAYLRNIFGRSQPTYLYDADLTQKDLDAVKKAIEASPPDAAYRKYAVGQLLVRQSRRQGPEGVQIEGLSPAERDLLAVERSRYLEAERTTRPWQRWGRLAGRATILLLVTAIIGIYVAHYEPRIIENRWRALALALVILTTLALSKAMVLALGLNPYSALLGVLLAAFILAIAHDQRFALAIASALCALIVMQLRQDFSVFLVFLAGAAAGVFQLREIRTRSKVIKVALTSAGAVLATICALGLSGDVPWRFVLPDGAWAAGGAVLAGLLVQGSLPMVERTFRIATSMTLLEWCDASKPLLKRLAMEAPGTYNHSLQLGAMCETAADAIAARGLLARVGAYYHDIGKIDKPEYFVENQAGSPSKHDKLSPAMSLLIIVGHVKDGLEMAREYGLPSVLHSFIATHHGTTLVQYFYHAATEQRKGNADRAPDEVEFRYPGPKPQHKEAGILMLADAAESSVRAMTDPTPGRIENQVHAVITRRLMDGQLDECDMTLREVHQVEASLVKSLCGIHHVRISYPAPLGQEPSAGELRAERKQEKHKLHQAEVPPSQPEQQETDLEAQDA